jgi:hypothetical protein
MPPYACSNWSEMVPSTIPSATAYNGVTRARPPVEKITSHSTSPPIRPIQNMCCMVGSSAVQYATATVISTLIIALLTVPRWSSPSSRDARTHTFEDAIAKGRIRCFMGDLPQRKFDSAAASSFTGRRTADEQRTNSRRSTAPWSRQGQVSYSPPEHPGFLV